MIDVLENRMVNHGKPFLAGTDRPTIADFKAFQFVTNGLIGNGCATDAATKQRVMSKIDDSPCYKRWVEAMTGELSGYLRDRPARPM